MAFILDASVTCAWIFADEAVPAVDALQDNLGVEGAWVPPFWWLEVANVLVQSARRGRIEMATVSQRLAELGRMNIHPSPVEPDIETVVDLSLTHGLTTYDALYLAHARRLLLPLATLDEPLRRAATVEGLAVWPAG